MEKRWVRWLVCLMLFLCGGIFFKILPAASFSFVLNWDAFSAVGTIAAVALSLYLATDADRKLLAEKK